MLGLTFCFITGYKGITEQAKTVKLSHIPFVIGNNSLTLLSLSLK